jgi:membrane-bound metal-dependent hydrolase YbcI (DUF457 family)
MMGYSHSLSGAAAWLAAAPVVALVAPMGPREVLMGAVVTAGGALLPDLDSVGSTASRALGGASRGFSRLVRHASGGHRQGTHSLLAAGLMGLLAQLGVVLGFSWAPVALVLWVGLRGLKLLRSAKTVLLAFAACVAGVVGLHYAGVGMSWVGVAVALGALAHLVGDALTPEGVPLMWAPWHRRARRYTLSLFTTNTWPEHLVVTPILVVGILLLGRLSLVG